MTKGIFGPRYSRMDHLNLFKACLPKILLGPFLNTLTHLGLCQLPMVEMFEKIFLIDVCQDVNYATGKQFFLDVWINSTMFLLALVIRKLINNG